MATVIGKSRKGSVVAGAYALMAAAEKAEKRASKQKAKPEWPAPAKKPKSPRSSGGKTSKAKK